MNYFKVEVDLVGLDSDAFRNDTLDLRTYLFEALLNPSQRGHIPWLIKILLTKWLDFIHLILTIAVTIGSVLVHL